MPSPYVSLTVSHDSSDTPSGGWWGTYASDHAEHNSGPHPSPDSAAVAAFEAYGTTGDRWCDAVARALLARMRAAIADRIGDAPNGWIVVID